MDYTYNTTNTLKLILQITVANISLFCLVGRYNYKFKDPVRPAHVFNMALRVICFYFTVQYGGMVKLNYYKNRVQNLTEL
jgi:hypothetical protein